MILQILRICDVFQFLWKSSWFFLKFISDMIEKQSIINFSIYSSKSYISVVVGDSKVIFLQEWEGVSFHPFLYWALFIHLLHNW